MQKEIRSLLLAAERQGFTVRASRRGHWIVQSAGRTVAVSAGTPSDWRCLRNFRAALRRAGFTG